MKGTLQALGKIVSAGEAHNSWVWKSFAWVGVFLAPVKPLMIAIGALIVIDLILGVWAALKSKEKITSRGLSRTIAKVIAYQLAIISSHIMETYFAQGVPIVKIVSGLIAVTEFKSILENVNKMTGVNIWESIIARFTRFTKFFPKKKEPAKLSTQKKKSPRKKRKKSRKKRRQ